MERQESAWADRQTPAVELAARAAAGAANAARGSGKCRPGAVTAASLVLQLAIGSPAFPHDWYTDFANPRTGEPCCNVDDCKRVASDAVRSTPQGWLVVETGEVVPYRETLRSEDRDFHLCRKGSWKEQRFLGPLVCLFAPPMAF